MDTNQAKEIANSLRSLYPLQDFEAEAISTLCTEPKPKKPISLILGARTKIGNLHFGKGCTVYKCAECGNFTGYLDKYCRDCGRPIDWSEKK